MIGKHRKIQHHASSKKNVFILLKEKHCHIRIYTYIKQKSNEGILCQLMCRENVKQNKHQYVGMVNIKHIYYKSLIKYTTTIVPKFYIKSVEIDM